MHIQPHDHQDQVSLKESEKAPPADAWPKVREAYSDLVKAGQHLYTGGKLGSGAFGDVFKCYSDEGKKKLVGALKLMQENGDHMAMGREIDLAARIKDVPGVVRILAEAQKGADGCMLMELLGGSLEEKKPRNGFTYATTLIIIDEVLATLEKLHVLDVSHKDDESPTPGLIHADIHPENILVIREPLSPTGHLVRLADFGRSKQAGKNLGAGAAGKPSTWPWRFFGKNGSTLRQACVDDVESLFLTAIQIFSKKPIAKAPSPNTLHKEVPFESRNEVKADKLCSGLGEFSTLCTRLFLDLYSSGPDAKDIQYQKYRQWVRQDLLRIKKEEEGVDAKVIKILKSATQDGKNIALQELPLDYKWTEWEKNPRCPGPSEHCTII